MGPVDAVAALSASLRFFMKVRDNLLLMKVEWGNVERTFGEARIFENLHVTLHVSPSDGKCRRVCRPILNDEAIIWGSTDAPFRDSDEMADFFQIDRERMRFRVPYVGGHF
jgi:hypothetical protein